MNERSNSIPIQRLNVSQAVLRGGLVAGVLDAIDGVVAFGFTGMNPIHVLQYIASGLLGPDSFQFGLASAALGTALHFLIAFVAATVFVLASQNFLSLTQQPVLWGLSFGVVVYFFMNYLVLPLSAVPKSRFSLGLFLNGVIGHAVFVGLPIALYAHRAASGK